MKRNATLALVALLPVFACTAPPTAAINEAIINGTVDTGDPAVVLSFAQVPGQMGGALCSAEIISPHVVLTAAHCMAPSEVGAGAQFVVFTGNTLGNDGGPPANEVLKVTESHFMPTFDFRQASGDFDDVGVLILEKPTSIPPLPVNHFALPASAMGSAARIVGYGLTDINDASSAGTKHQAPTIIYFVEDKSLTLFDSMHSDCSGDSGGPVLFTIDGKERIIGITAWGLNGCPVNRGAIDTRIDPFVGFIDKYVDMFDPPAVPAGGACTQDSDCGAVPCLNKICAQPCDPTATTSTCAMNTQCRHVDGRNMCVSGHGCAMGGDDPGGCGMLALFVSAAWLVTRRRKLRTR